MVKLCAVLLCMSSIVDAGLEINSPRSFIYIYDNSEQEEFILEGYIKQVNLERLSVDALTKHFHKEQEQEQEQGSAKKLNITPEVYIESTIDTIYKIKLASSGASSDFGVQPGLAFIVRLSDGSYLLTCQYKQKLQYYSLPKMSKNPILYNTLTQNREPIIFTQRIIGNLPSEILEGSGSKKLQETYFTHYVTTNLPYFHMAGRGSIVVETKNLSYELEETLEYSDDESKHYIDDHGIRFPMNNKN